MARRFLIVFLIPLIFVSLWPITSQAKPNWDQWVAQLRQEAIAQGISPDLFDQIYTDLTPNEQTISLDRGQPERRLTYEEYRKTRADNYRVQLGRKLYEQNYPLLSQVENDYGVDACFITSLWGMESSYGRYMGNFDVIRTLSTLAYDDRRSEFFRKELLLALQILQGGHIDREHFKGEWAGASGQPQFLPSSWYKFAVDYDGDGHKDIWTDKGDVYASIANYLNKNGWQANQPWGFEVIAPDDLNDSNTGYDHKKSISEWRALGVTLKDGTPLPDVPWSAAVLKPYGGPTLLVFNNFQVLLRYNNSTFYAGAVAYMADSICRR